MVTAAIHPLVASVVQTYLDAVDAERPGLVEGLYLVGSVALGDFRPRTSDIDFVAVTAGPPAAASAALRRVHARVAAAFPRPYFDGIYVTWNDLAGDPALAAAGPRSYAGRFFEDRDDAPDPVAWQTLAASGVTCRGPQPRDITIRTDPSALAAWTLDNLDRYWRPLLRDASRLVHRQSLLALTSWGTVWIVLGVPRLHYTLATGRITSKDGAGEYALRAFPPQWHGVIEEALRLRRADVAPADWRAALREVATTSPARLVTRRRAALAFARMVIDDAQVVAPAAPIPLQSSVGAPTIV